MNFDNLDWDPQKNISLKNSRGVNFDDVRVSLQNSLIHDVVPHYNNKKYPHQYIMFVEIKKYIYLVPFVIDEGRLFLKTVIPSGRHTNKYLREKK